MRQCNHSHCHSKVIALAQSVSAVKAPAVVDDWTIRQVAQCASTNDLILAQAQAQAGAPDRTVIICTDQRAGRGRRGNDWVCRPGESLACSLLWSSGRPQAQLGWLPIATGIGVARALRSLTGAPIQLKWPNDLICHGAKLAGILVETVPGMARTQCTRLVIGIGINLHGARALSGELHRPISDLASLAGRPVGVHDVMAPLLREVGEQLGLFESRDDPLCVALLERRWAELDALTGRTIEFTDGARSLAGVAVGLANDGGLRVMTANGMKTVYSGDVSIRSIEPSQ